MKFRWRLTTCNRQCCYGRSGRILSDPEPSCRCLQKAIQQAIAPIPTNIGTWRHWHGFCGSFQDTSSLIIRFVTGATSGCVETSYLTSSFETPFSDELGILAHGRVVEFNALGEVQVVLPASLKGATYSHLGITPFFQTSCLRFSPARTIWVRIVSSRSYALKPRRPVCHATKIW